MTKTTLMNIFRKYRLGEADVSTELWEAGLDDNENHYIAILDASTLYIIDTDELNAGKAGFCEGTVINIQF